MRSGHSPRFTSSATKQDIGPQTLRFQYALYGCTHAGIIIDDEHRGIMCERHPPPSGKCQGMLATLEHSPPPFTLKLHEGSALLAGKVAVLFYSEKLRGDVVFSL
jgi:hypothetical protein